MPDLSSLLSRIFRGLGIPQDQGAELLQRTTPVVLLEDLSTPVNLDATGKRHWVQWFSVPSNAGFRSAGEIRNEVGSGQIISIDTIWFSPIAGTDTFEWDISSNARAALNDNTGTVNNFIRDLRRGMRLDALGIIAPSYAAHTTNDSATTLALILTAMSTVSGGTPWPVGVTLDPGFNWRVRGGANAQTLIATVLGSEQPITR